MFLVFIPNDISVFDYHIHKYTKRNNYPIYYKDEPNNIYDSEAVAIYTKLEGKEYKIGYIQKKIFLFKDSNDENVYDYIFTDKDKMKMKALKANINSGNMYFLWNDCEEVGHLVYKK